MSKRVRGLLLGLVAAVMPLAALAQESSGRSLPAASDWHIVMFLTAAGILGIMLLAGIGYLYRRERHLDWEFQKPDQPHADGGH